MSMFWKYTSMTFQLRARKWEKKGKTLGTANQETLFCLFKKENQKLIQEFLCKLEAKSLYFIITFLFLDTVFSVRVDKIWQQALWLCVWIWSP